MLKSINSIIDDANDKWDEFTGGIEDAIVDYFGLPDRDENVYESTTVPKDKKNLRYPISDNHQYKAQVIFRITTDDEAAVQTLGEKVVQRTTNTPPWATKVDVEQDTTEINPVAALAFQGANNQTKKQGVQIISQQRCSMYLPHSLNISDAVFYNNTALDRVGALAERNITHGQGVAMNTIKGWVEDAASTIQGFASNKMDDVAKYAALTAAKNVLSDQLYGAVKSGLRVTTNPNLRALFESVPMRYFDFTFKMIAKDKDEAEEIKAIIKWFRTALYPESISISDDQSFNISTMYAFPDKFRIDIVHRTDTGELKPMATRIKPAYLTNVDVVYNASGMALHKDGNFTEVDLSLKFQEAKALTRADIKAGF